MPGNKIGAAKRRQTLIAKHGSLEAYLKRMREQASKGGSTITEKTKYRGWGSMDKAELTRVGRIGGSKSRRRKESFEIGQQED